VLRSSGFSNTDTNTHEWSMDEDGHVRLPHGHQLFVNNIFKVAAAFPNRQHDAQRVHKSGLLMLPDSCQLCVVWLGAHRRSSLPESAMTERCA